MPSDGKMVSKRLKAIRFIDRGNKFFIFGVLKTMKKLYLLTVLLGAILGLRAQGPCQLKLEEVYLDTAASDCNHLFFKYKVSGGTVSNYYWNYGDGNSCTCLHPKHTYTQNGTFQLCGRIEDANGCKDSMCINVTVNCSDPCDLSEIGIYSADTLSYSCNEYEFNTIVSKNTKVLNWDFGDGNTSADAFTTHRYASNGTYNVKLIIKDSIDCADTANWQVLVDCKDMPCDIRITSIDTSSVHDCHTKRFSIATNHPTKLIWWEFGDGQSGLGNVTETHYYKDSGLYRVCIYAYDSSNCVDTSCFNILVNCKGSNSSIHSSSIQQWIKASVFSQSIEIDIPTTGSFELLDMNGKLVLSAQLKEGSHQIATVHIERGVYTISIYTKDGNERKMLIKL